MSKQLELLNIKKPRPSKPKEAADLEMMGPSETFGRERVRKTLKPHKCERCENEIPTGSQVMRIVPITGGEKDYEKTEYYHLKNECPAWNK